MTVTALPLRTASADPDVAAIRAMARGDREALQRFYERRGRAVLAYLIGQLGDRGLAEEVLQDVMLAVWGSAASFRGESKVNTWLLTIAHNRALNARRRRRVTTTAVDPRVLDRRHPDPARTDAADERADLRAALRTLSTEQRAALDLVFYHGLTVVEAADVLRVAPGTVKSRLHRAKASLRAHLEPEPDREV